MLSRGTCLPVVELTLLRRSRFWWWMLVGVVSSPATLLEAVDPSVRLRLRIVTVDGTVMEERGEARGGV